MERIVLDTDLSLGEPGSEIDDGIALALALAEPEMDLLAVTTVFGNTDVATATELSRRILSRFRRDEIPVYPGAHRPLVVDPHRTPRTAAGAAPELHGAVMLAHLAREYAGELTIVAIGPLTNLALALRLDSSFATNVREVVAMGGQFFGQNGRLSQPGEFNFWVDPEAADIVLTSGIPLRLVGLDVTSQVRITISDLASEDDGDNFASFAATYVKSWITRLQERFPGSGVNSCALHDPLAVIALTRPELFTWEPACIRVSTALEITRGVATADLLHYDHAPEPNCYIASAVDAHIALESILGRLALKNPR